MQTACLVEFGPADHIINFVYGPGTHNFEIIGEIVAKLPITEFPDFDGDGEITIVDIAKVSKFYGRFAEEFYP